MQARLLRLGAVAIAATSLSVGWIVGFPSAAAADSPNRQGWWTVTSPVVAPDVPASGLLVQGGAESPTAYSALVYELPQGAAVGSLILKITSGRATTSGSMLQVCVLEHPPFKPEQGGSMSDAPQYDCARKSAAQPASDGASYRFDVASLVTGSTLAVAVLGTQATDRVVFDQPGDNSLTVQQAPPSGGTTTAEPVTAGTATDAQAPGATSATASGLVANGGSAVADPDVQLGAAPSAPAPSVAAQAAPTVTGPTASQAPSQVATAAHNAGGESRPLAVGLIIAGLAVAGGLWSAAGHSATRTKVELYPTLTTGT